MTFLVFQGEGTLVAHQQVQKSEEVVVPEAELVDLSIKLYVDSPELEEEVRLENVFGYQI